MLKLTNCAMVDDKTETPGRITNHWKVWHEDTQQMRIFGDTDPILKMPKGLIFKQEMRPIDKLEVQSVVGFEVSGIQRNGHIHQLASLLLRHPSLYYGRPVYEAENGGQYLYWQALDEPSGAGVAFAELLGPGQVAQHKDLDDKEGMWMIGDQVGLTPENAKVKAYVKDMSMTPDQISDDSSWCIKDATNRSAPLAIMDKSATRVEDKVQGEPVEWNPKFHAPISVGQTVR